MAFFVERECASAGARSDADTSKSTPMKRATTFMVLSNVNKFVVVGFGMVVLREAHSWQAIVGCCVALSGGIWYAQARAAASARRL